MRKHPRNFRRCLFIYTPARGAAASIHDPDAILMHKLPSPDGVSCKVTKAQRFEEIKFSSPQGVLSLYHICGGGASGRCPGFQNQKNFPPGLNCGRGKPIDQ